LRRAPYHTHLHLVFWAGEHPSRAAAIEAVRPLGVELDEPELARVPTGFDAQAPGADWLRHKGLVVQAGKRRYPSVLFGPSAVDHIAGLCAGLAAQPLFGGECLFVRGIGRKPAPFASRAAS